MQDIFIKLNNFDLSGFINILENHDYKLILKKMLKKILLIVLVSFFLLSCWQQRDIFNEETAKTFINKNIESPFYWDLQAKVQLVIYSDFQCPACIRFESAIGNKLLNDYALTNKIGLTYKNFPLNIHKNAPEDALASMCAHEQDKYKEFAINMYSLEEEKNWLILTLEDRQWVAQKSGLDMTKFNQCVLEWRYVDKIKQDMIDWEKIWLQWTPSVYANGTLINYTDEENFFKIIDSLIKK